MVGKSTVYSDVHEGAIKSQPGFENELVALQRAIGVVLILFLWDHQGIQLQ